MMKIFSDISKILIYHHVIVTLSKDDFIRVYNNDFSLCHITQQQNITKIEFNANLWVLNTEDELLCCSFEHTAHLKIKL